MLSAAGISLPLSEGDVGAAGKFWFWDGHTATTLSRDVSRSTSTSGSNLAVAESAAVPYLSADGKHLYWFSNQARRLQRDGVDLSTKTKWLAWRTDLTGGSRQELASITLPECSCPTGGCEETCPYVEVWAPPSGVLDFFLLTQFIAGKTNAIYKAASIYSENGGTWAATALDPPLRRVLDASREAFLEAVPDSGCCGWSNQSDDQTLLRVRGKKLPLFDERETYKNPDYDVSFFTENGRLSPDGNAVALTVVATAQANQPIQIAEQGQADPEESRRIRKALLDLPAVEIIGATDTPRRIAFLPHATLLGWIGDKEILILEEHFLVAYNIATGTRRKSAIRVEDATYVFVR
jgi:hypothetical protein